MKVTKAMKAYSTRKADKSLKGYTLAELVEKLSRLHDIPPSRTFRREVAQALRRGVDYGILVKSKNKYRFDPEKSLSNFVKSAARRQGRVPKSVAKAAKSTARVARKHMGTRVSKGDETPSNNSPPSVPRPTVPPPPNFTPKPRNLVTEPFKVIKHRKQK